MKLVMHSVHFDADQKLIDFIQHKTDKLDTFHDGILNGEVYLRVEKDTEYKQNKIVEIKLFVPGGSFFAQERSNSFESAADTVVEALKTQLKRAKEKLVERLHA